MQLTDISILDEWNGVKKNIENIENERYINQIRRNKGSTFSPNFGHSRSLKPSIKGSLNRIVFFWMSASLDAFMHQLPHIVETSGYEQSFFLQAMEI